MVFSSNHVNHEMPVFDDPLQGDTSVVNREATVEDSTTSAIVGGTEVVDRNKATVEDTTSMLGDYADCNKQKTDNSLLSGSVIVDRNKATVEDSTASINGTQIVDPINGTQVVDRNKATVEDQPGTSGSYDDSEKSKTDNLLLNHSAIVDRNKATVEDSTASSDVSETVDRNKTTMEDPAGPSGNDTACELEQLFQAHCNTDDRVQAPATGEL